MSKIALGTVQFGMNYGVSNKTGQVSVEEIEKILAFCKSNGIDVLDTAQGYGESEKVLGKFELKFFKVITKLIGDARLEYSLENLNMDKIYALMFHRENECNDKTWKIYEGYKDQGLVSKIGVSVYTPKILIKLLERYPIEIVQVPMNILDQRFIPYLPMLKEKGIEIHTRSTFLQGLLLMDSIPEYFNPVMNIISEIPHPRLEHSLNFVKKQMIDKVVVGVTRPEELTAIYKAYSIDLNGYKYESFAINDENYINPANWRFLK